MDAPSRFQRGLRYGRKGPAGPLSAPRQLQRRDGRGKYPASSRAAVKRQNLPMLCRRLLRRIRRSEQRGVPRRIGGQTRGDHSLHPGTLQDQANQSVHHRSCRAALRETF